MKETMDPTTARQPVDDENFANRKLIRPALPRVEHNHGNHNSNHNANHMPAERRDRHERPERGQDRGYEGPGRAVWRRWRRTEDSASGADQCGEFLLSEADAVADTDGNRAARWRRSARHH